MSDSVIYYTVFSKNVKPFFKKNWKNIEHPVFSSVWHLQMVCIGKRSKHFGAWRTFTCNPFIR